MEPLEFVFKMVNGLDICLDIYLPEHATAESPASVCVWWHGGGLFQGTRKGCPPNLKSLPLRSNIAFVSADYRLAPQANLNLILEDTVDAIAYVRDTLPAKVDNRIDPRKLAISGGSAGGWLALLAGIPVEGVVGALVPPPTCVVAIYPITDVDTPFYITKQRPVSYLKEIIPDNQAAGHLELTSPVLSSSALTSPRSIVYHYALQEALWHHLWFANVSTQSPSASSNPADYSVSTRLNLVNVKAIKVPPTFVTSGSLDDKVDPDGARLLVKKMEELGMDVEWDHRVGADHLFDQNPEEKMERMHVFLERHLL